MEVGGCLLISVLLCSTLATVQDLPDVHLKPFGYGKQSQVEEFQGNPTPKVFFNEYVRKNKPVVMRGMAKVWPAFDKWASDDYFYSVAPKEPFMVAMDMKYGDPEGVPSKLAEWKDFLGMYNASKRRMVHDTPNFLWKDIVLPGCLQCDVITRGEFLMGHKMWFGNNYTASTVHKDAADNINCLVKGIKEYTIVEPKYQKYVVLDKPQALYSSMDVDAVDNNRFPGLDKVEYLVSTLQPGDCMFVPYKWIHQVRSYDRNIAVNIWWNYWKDNDINIDSCPTKLDRDWTIIRANFSGWADMETRDAGIKEHLIDQLTLAMKPVSWPRFIVLFSKYASIDGDIAILHKMDKEVRDELKKVFKAVDSDGDKQVTVDDLTELNEDQWKPVIESMRIVLRRLRESAAGNPVAGSNYASGPPKAQQPVTEEADKKDELNLSEPGLKVTGDDLPDVHMKPFGYGNQSEVEEYQGNPSPKYFFQEYVLKSKPVVLRGMAKVWPAFKNWATDEYFYSVAPKEPYMVQMDLKTGDPNVPAKYADWKEFLGMYNTSKRRMVNDTPRFLWKDVLLPGCLQCDAFTRGEFLMGNKMWFGNNYTTSQVHKDAADNINCVVHGIKHYTIVAPKYENFIVFDKPQGLYSTMNVDAVDYNKFPGLDKVEYQVSTLQPGDCMFIPYKWIHQVRSYGRNIAVNIWWNFWKNTEVDVDSCPSEMDMNWNIVKVNFTGWGDFETRDNAIKEHCIDQMTLAKRPVTWPKFVVIFSQYASIDGEVAVLHRLDKDIRDELKKIFKFVDADGDKLITAADFTNLTDDDWTKIIPSLKYVMKKLREASEGKPSSGSSYASGPPKPQPDLAQEASLPSIGIVPNVNTVSGSKDEL